jgi:hypothetical protein
VPLTLGCVVVHAKDTDHFVYGRWKETTYVRYNRMNELYLQSDEYRDTMVTFVGFKAAYTTTKINKLRSLSPRANYTDRVTALVGEISTNFCREGGCRVVSAAYSNIRNLGFLDRSRYFFLSSSSSIVIMRLSGPLFQITTSQKKVVAPGIEAGPLDL